MKGKQNQTNQVYKRTRKNIINKHNKCIKYLQLQVRQWTCVVVFSLKVFRCYHVLNNKKNYILDILRGRLKIQNNLIKNCKKITYMVFLAKHDELLQYHHLIWNEHPY